MRARREYTASVNPASDTHLYIDMSGGIRREDWMPVVTAEVERLRVVAKELGHALTLRLTAFSHDLADDAAPIKVTESYPSEEELAALIDQMPETSGGTEFRLVWERINTGSERAGRDNVIVSDLMWTTSTDEFRHQHPNNLRYMAIAGIYPDAKQRFIDRLTVAQLDKTTTVD